MAPPSGTNFLDGIGVNDGSSSSNHGESSTAGSANPHILTTQMALLLYLGEYSQARHLWRRHRKTPTAAAASASDDAAANPETSNNADEGENNAANSNSSDGDYAQLEQLWNAAKYMYLWSTGGIHSLTSSASSSTSSTDENEMMQVETNTNTDSSSNNSSDTNNGDDLPFSTMAMRALQQQSCSKNNIEPLATYSTELLGVFRSRVNRSLHQSFEKLSVNEFNLRMNLNDDDCTSAVGEGEEGAWNAFGWKKEGEYLISDVDVVLDDDSSVEEGRGNGVLEGGDRIGKLTEVVMFLEGKMNA